MLRLSKYWFRDSKRDLMILQQYKIVFAGSMGAGKTTAIRALSDIAVLETEALNTDTSQHQKILTTVGIDYGEIHLVDGTKIGLYGTPGQERFNFVWKVVSQGAIGTIILIDHSNNNRFKDLELYIQNFNTDHQPLVIGITHLEKYDHQSLKNYRDWMALYHYDFPIFAIDARQKDDVLFLTEVLIASVEIQHIAYHA